MRPVRNEEENGSQNRREDDDTVDIRWLSLVTSTMEGVDRIREEEKNC